MLASRHLPSVSDIGIDYSHIIKWGEKKDFWGPWTNIQWPLREKSPLSEKGQE